MSNTEPTVVSYCVTGTDVSGKRFKIERANYFHIACINVYRGTLWEVLSTGKRKRLRTYYN